MTSLKNARDNNFDLLRFFFAFIVVLGHLIVISKAEVFQKFSPYINTNTSVTAFFSISGFLIASSYLKTNSLKQYFDKRAARLLPAYGLVIIACSLLLPITGKLSLSEYLWNSQLYKYLIYNLSFLNFLQPTLPGVFVRGGIENPVNGALWTLKVEVAFYLTIPILITFINRFKWKYIPILIIYVSSLSYQLAFDWYFQKTGNPMYQLLSRQLPGYLTYFVSGIALYYYFDDFVKNKNKLFIVGITIYILERIYGIHILTPIALSLLIFVFAYSLKQLNSFAKHGDVSYGIYIYHCPLINLAVQYNLFERYNPYLVALILIVILLTLSFASWHLLEKIVLQKVHRKTLARY